MYSDLLRFRRRVLGNLRAGLDQLKLGTVRDPRRHGGRKHRVPGLLRMALLGLCSGASTLREVEALSEDLEPRVRKGLRIGHRVPDTSLRSVLVAIDPDDLRRVNADLVRRAIRRKSIRNDRFPCGVVSIDGKTTMTPLVRGPFAQSQSETVSRGAVRTMTSTLISSSAFPCLDASPIPAATNEVGHFADAFRSLCSDFGEHFEVIMGDAGFLSAASADLVDAAGKGYAFQVKDNAPTLVTAVAKCMAAGKPVATAESKPEREDGRWVVRRVSLFAIDPTLDAWDTYLHAKLFVRVERIESKTIAGTGDVLAARTFITNLTVGRFTADQWVRLVRDRWAVENQNHGTFDIAFREDERPWIKEPQGLLVATILRRIASNRLSLFRSVTQRSADKREIAWRKLMTVARDALVTATIDALAALRPRTPTTQ